MLPSSEIFKVRKNERQGFENLRRIIKVERRGSRGDKTYEETAYYISSVKVKLFTDSRVLYYLFSPKIGNADVVNLGARGHKTGGC